MNATAAILYREFLILKRRAGRTIVSIGLTPLLYAIAFGWGLGSGLSMDGLPYISFMLPGLIALSGMGQSFGIGTEINIDRFYSFVFEEALLAPSKPAYIALGYVAYGMVKGFFSYIFCVALAILFDPGFSWNPWSLVPAVLNMFQFASLGVFVALAVRTHRDMNAVSNFVIVPMSFLAGTFFSLDALPVAVRNTMNILPLTPATKAIRDAWRFGAPDPVAYCLMAVYGCVFFSLAATRVKKAMS